MQDFGGLQTEYTNYDRQKCFVAHSVGAEWSEDLKSACAAILPKFNLEPWYAADHFDPTQPLRDKVVELIANSRYGIYDISSWQDLQGNWQLPRNVFIELGIAIALNRPTLLLRHSSNKNRPLPACLQGIETVEFAGDFTLKKELEKRLPQWLDVPPDRDWLNRFCIFGDRVCSFREQHPCSQQWEQTTLHCHIADGLDKQHPNYCQSECDEIRGAFEEIFSRYSDLEFSYLDERSIVDGYQFLLCSHCQTVRSTPFAIYRISPTTSAETFVAIGISIALEKLFAYKIPKVILIRQEQDLPSLLRGYEVVEVINTKEIKHKIKAFLPKLIEITRDTSWRPRPFPFTESLISKEFESLKTPSVQDAPLAATDNLLTEVQQQLYNWLVDYVETNQHSPSIRQMMKAMGLKSPAPIQSRLENLKAKGYIDWAEGKARTIRLSESPHEGSRETNRPKTNRVELQSLTEAQRKLYDWLVDYVETNQHSPSIHQMMKAMGLNSRASIQSMLQHLRTKGYIDWAEGRARTIRLLVSIDFLSRIISEDPLPLSEEEESPLRMNDDDEDS